MLWWKRREVWLAALSVVLVAVLYHQLSAWLLPATRPDLVAPPAAGGAGRGRSLAADAVPDVKLDALASARSSYDPRGRNLFQYGQRQAPTPPPPPPEVVQQQEMQRRMEEEEQRRRVEAILAQKAAEEERLRQQQQTMQPQQPPPPAAAAAAPEADYKFVGYMGKAADKIAVLMHDGEVVLAKEGERLGKDFVVRQIEFDTVELGYTDPKFKAQKKLLPMGN